MRLGGPAATARDRARPPEEGSLSRGAACCAPTSSGRSPRARLAGVVWPPDIRRAPSEDAGAMQALFAARQTRVLAALTKSDKLPQGERRRRERALAAALRLDADQAVVTSARTGEGVAELRDAIGALIGSTGA